MKKRIISVFTLALMLTSILIMSAIPASAKSGFNDVLEFSATASGYVVNDTTYCPNFSKYSSKERNDFRPDAFEVTLEANASPFYTDKDCKNPLRSAPVKGQTYYFYIQTQSRMDKDYSYLKKENCKLTMDGITASVLSVKPGSETKPNNPNTYYYVRINCSARIDALPVESVTISGFDMPTVGAYPDTSVTIDSTCNVAVTWETGIKHDTAKKPANEKITGTEILVATFKITPKSGYYFPGNGRNVTVKMSNGQKLLTAGHGKSEITMRTEQIRMEKLTKVDWKFSGVAVNATESFCYLTGSQLNATFSSGTKYTLNAPDRYLFTDEELERELKREPKEGTTYYTRISISDSTAIPTFSTFDATKNLTVTVDGFDVKILKQSYEPNSYSGDKIWFYLSLTKPIPTFRVTFENAGGSGMMKDVVMEEGRYTLPECTFTPPAGKQFKAWMVSGRERAPGYEMTVRENLTVTAVWEDIPAVTYKVTFAAGGGTGTMKVVDTVGAYALPRNGFTAPSGKQFKAWKVNGAEKQPGDSINVTANTTVTAVWESIPATTYKVTFSAGGGKGIMKAVTDISGSYILPECEYTAPAGQQFMAWDVDGVEKQPGDSIYVNANKQVTALWENIPEETTEPDVTEPADMSEPIEEPTKGTEDTKIPEESEQQKQPAGQPSADDKDNATGVPVWAIILICIGCAVVGLLVTVLIVIKKK